MWLFCFLTPLLKMSSFSLCVSGLLPSSLTIFTVTTLNSFLSKLPSSTSLGSPLRFYLVPLSEICSSVTPFCLSRSLYFYVSGRLAMFPDLGKVASCGRRLIYPSSGLSSCQPSSVRCGSPLWGLCVSFFVVGWLCRWSGRLCWPLLQLVTRLCLMWRSLAGKAGSQGHWLWNPEGPGASVGSWWGESGSGRLWCCCPPTGPRAN